MNGRMETVAWYTLGYAARVTLGHTTRVILGDTLVYTLLQCCPTYVPRYTGVPWKIFENNTNRTLCAILVMLYHQGVPWLKKGWTTLP